LFAETPADAREDDLGQLTEVVVRKLKRALQDEQNLILDGIRQVGDVTDIGAVMPPSIELSQRLESAVVNVVDETLRTVGQPAAAVGERVRDGIRGSIGESLHAEVCEVLEQAVQGGEGGAMTSDRVSRVFRVWRTERLEEAVHDVLSHALAGHV
jgi:hypothetical protein